MNIAQKIEQCEEQLAVKIETLDERVAGALSMIRTSGIRLTQVEAVILSVKIDYAATTMESIMQSHFQLDALRDVTEES